MAARETTVSPATPADAKGHGVRTRRTRKRYSTKAAAARRNGDVYSLDDLLEALRELEEGNFEVQLPEVGDAVMVQIAQSFNRVAALNNRTASELGRISRTVGREGKMKDRASVTGVQGGWQEIVDSANALITDLVQPTTEIARVLTAVAEGNLGEKMVLEIEGKSVQGEFLRIGTTVNRMVDQLGSFASEVTRVAREVGTDGKLGGQAQVTG